ncbi:MAG TPA: tetratricopeptide repeat protein, partial [Oscillatoriaceae cyanobacterium M33_DOE_052]|nr:tetratricopeptide repeat protein [Oscillatoriaceae cyanobacterium M33_DOE_052]
MRLLSGDTQKGFWGGVGDWIKSTAKAIILPGQYNADTISETQRRNTDTMIAANAALEERREQIQLAQLKMQYLQHQENRDFQIAQAERNLQAQKDLQVSNQHFQAEQSRLSFERQQRLQEFNQRFQAEQAELSFERQKQLQEYIQSVNQEMQRENLAFQKWRFEQEKALQGELAAYNRQTQLEIATYQRETAIKLATVQAEVQKIFANWPLTLPPTQILQSQGGQSQVPLRIFVAPPKIQFEKFANGPQTFPDVELTLNEGLRQFFAHYNSSGRTIEFLAGAWESKRFHSEASVKALFGMLQSEPTLILESEIDGDYLNFRIAYWGVGQEKYAYQSIISRLPYRDILYDAAKTRALKWREAKQKLLALGKPLPEVEKRGGDNEINLKILEEEEILLNAEIDLPTHYKINSQHFDDFYQFLVTCHCLVAGWIADSHHLLLHECTPLLPELLPSLTQNIPDVEVAQQVVNAVVVGYQEIYQALEANRSHWIPELMLQLATGLANLSDKSWGKNQLVSSLQFWLKLYGSDGVAEPDLWHAVDAVVTVQDSPYIDQVNACLLLLGESHRVNIVEACNQRGQKHSKDGDYAAAVFDFSQVLLLESNFPNANYNRGLAYAKLGEFAAAIEDYTQALRLNPNHAGAYNNRGNAYYKLGQYEKAIADYDACLTLNPNLPNVQHNRDVAQGVWDEKRRQEELKRQEEEKQREKEQKQREEEAKTRFTFDVITVDKRGNQTSKVSKQAQYYRQDLGNGIFLDMVAIPEGKFQMGTPNSEPNRQDYEGPQHQVTVPSFYMAKY